jgi:hypothetical protein
VSEQITKECGLFIEQRFKIKGALGGDQVGKADLPRR